MTEPPTEPVRRQPADDFIDAPPTDEPSWPPLGAYPDEPPPAAASADSQATEVHPEGWHQPAPSEPFHARHEKPGEWQTQPPEHLAFQHSPPAETLPPQQFADGPTRQIAMPPPVQPWEVPLAAEPPKKKRTGLWVSLALTVIVLLCAGGGLSAFLILRNTDTGGAPDPASAVEDFMTAVYTRQDATAAEDLVCREARDPEALAERVREIKGYETDYEGPTFQWTEPEVSGQTEDRATVTTKLTLSTTDEKSSEQTLTFVTVRKTNWLVCEITG
jgi:hypothetical protein